MELVQRASYVDIFFFLDLQLFGTIGLYQLFFSDCLKLYVQFLFHSTAVSGIQKKSSVIQLSF